MFVANPRDIECVIKSCESNGTNKRDCTHISLMHIAYMKKQECAYFRDAFVFPLRGGFGCACITSSRSMTSVSVATQTAFQPFPATLVDK